MAVGVGICAVPQQQVSEALVVQLRSSVEWCPAKDVSCRRVSRGHQQRLSALAAAVAFHASRDVERRDLLRGSGVARERWLELHQEMERKGPSLHGAMNNASARIILR